MYPKTLTRKISTTQLVEGSITSKVQSCVRKKNSISSQEEHRQVSCDEEQHIQNTKKLHLGGLH
jgi:hypothetical protein